jgi:hypothetical protein
MKKMMRFLATLSVAIALTGSLTACSHLRSADQNEDKTAVKKAPDNVMPGGDRYGGAPGSR